MLFLMNTIFSLVSVMLKIVVEARNLKCYSRAHHVFRYFEEYCGKETGNLSKRNYFLQNKCRINIHLIFIIILRHCLISV